MTDKITGFSRNVINGITGGLDSDVVGVVNEVASLPKRVYKANSIKDLINLYKDSGQEYERAKTDYKQLYDDFKRENPYTAFSGETIGRMIPVGAGVKVARYGIDAIRTVQEVNRLKKAYDEVLNEPFKGTREGKEDIMVEIKPIGDKNKYVINRGAAIKDKNGNPVFQDKKPLTELFDQTGTSKNFGVAKMLYHGLSREESAKIPKIVRKYKPFVKESNGNLNYKVPLDKSYDLLVGFSNSGKNEKKFVTGFKNDLKDRKKVPLSQKK